ncbi:hypothetical protein HMPREF3150_02235 [Pseudomonas aeruginosa]|nr:hypothetical protein HMPREF3150_02235 [Pseudomonas aeruginosa]
MDLAHAAGYRGLATLQQGFVGLAHGFLSGRSSGRPGQRMKAGRKLPKAACDDRLPRDLQARQGSEPLRDRRPRLPVRPVPPPATSTPDGAALACRPAPPDAFLAGLRYRPGRGT